MPLTKRKGRKPTGSDWIAMRMLYLVLCGDTSASLIRDVNKTIAHLRSKLGDNFYPSMSLIVSEHGRLGTFQDPAIALGRKLNSAIEFRNKSEWSDAKEPIYDLNGMGITWTRT